MLTAVAAAAALIGLPAVTGSAAFAEAAPGPVVVSLTFDDGPLDQYQYGVPLLESHGMRGTFYVNSGRIGATGYASQEDLAEMEANGHEIGGHTVDHADLPTLSADDQRREICDDRVALLNRGFQVKNLAYPFGDADATTMSIAQACGYNSARGVGGIRSGHDCSGCPYTEVTPPTNMYLSRATSSVKTDTTFADMTNYVTNAENNGGGWVTFVLHHVCESECGGVYTISPTLLNQFLDWLEPRADRGTIVKTLDQVIGGTVQPGVNGPTLPMEPGNLVPNPSLEAVGSANLPSCYQLGGFGSNSFSWNRVTDAHTGGYAEQLDITNYTTGDRKLVMQQNTGGCSPHVTPGNKYRARVWYKGAWGPATQVRLVVYYRDSDQVWKYWKTGPVLPTGETWQQSTDFVTPAVPAGATALSFGLAMTGRGSLVTDDYSLAVAP